MMDCVGSYMHVVGTHLLMKRVSLEERLIHRPSFTLYKYKKGETHGITFGSDSGYA